MKLGTLIKVLLLVLLVTLCSCLSSAKISSPIVSSKLRIQHNTSYKTSSLFAQNQHAHQQRQQYECRTLASRYNDLLMRYPYSTKMVSSGIVGGLGDILVQFLGSVKAGETFHLDVRRLIVFFTVATFYIAPVIHLWFNWLDKVKVPSIFGKNKTIKSLVMIALDQSVGAVGISMGFFYAFELAQFLVPPHANSASFLAAFEAGRLMNKRLLWRTLVVNWYCWPVINFLNFHYVPIQYRLLVSNIAAVFWNMFLSNVANS